MVVLRQRSNLIVPIIAIIAALAIGWQVGHWGKETQLDAYRAQIEQFKEDAKEATEYADSLTDVNSAILDTLSHAQEVTQQLETKAAKLASANQQINHQVGVLEQKYAAVKDSVPPEAQEYIGSLEGQVRGLQAELNTEKQLNLVQGIDIRLYRDLYTNEKLRADSLQTVISAFPTDKVPNPEKLFGFIPMPSRTVSFITGVAAGAVGLQAITSG